MNAFLFLILCCSVVIISIFTAFQTECVTSPGTSTGTIKLECAGVTATTFRDIYNSHTGLVPYYSYAFEYFIIGGLLQFTVNIFTYLTHFNDFVTIVFSNLLMSIFVVLSILLLYKFKVPPKRLAFILTPIAFLFSLNFDYAQIFFILLSVWFLKKNNILASGIIYGIACGIKAYPILFLPFLLQDISTSKFLPDDILNQRDVNWINHFNFMRKVKLAIVIFTTFGTEIIFQYALNPTNFIHATSYLTTYGVEGSWLGLLFPQDVINYETTSTWLIGSGTQIPIPHEYQILSAALFLGALFAIYRFGKFLSIWDKLFLGFSSSLIFLWISAPQMFLNLVILAPLTTIALTKLNLTLYNLASFFSCDLLILAYLFQFHGGPLVSLYLQILAMGFLIFLIANAYLRYREPLIPEPNYQALQ